MRWPRVNQRRQVENVARHQFGRGSRQGKHNNAGNYRLTYARPKSATSRRGHFPAPTSRNGASRCSRTFTSTSVTQKINNAVFNVAPNLA